VVDLILVARNDDQKYEAEAMTKKSKKAKKSTSLPTEDPKLNLTISSHDAAWLGKWTERITDTSHEGRYSDGVPIPHREVYNTIIESLPPEVIVLFEEYIASLLRTNKKPSDKATTSEHSTTSDEALPKDSS
jgi:hypothetical protein